VGGEDPNRAPPLRHGLPLPGGRAKGTPPPVDTAPIREGKPSRIAAPSQGRRVNPPPFAPAGATLQRSAGLIPDYRDDTASPPGQGFTWSTHRNASPGEPPTPLQGSTPALRCSYPAEGRPVAAPLDSRRRWHRAVARSLRSDTLETKRGAFQPLSFVVSCTALAPMPSPYANVAASTTTYGQWSRSPCACASCTSAR